MIRVPAKYKKSISSELKRYVPHIINLVQRGKESTEEDARILLNDILSDVLGYDKYNELKTEQRDKNHRLDYVVKLINTGKAGRKSEKPDFIIEAKAANVQIAQTHIDQTLAYCIGLGIDFFVVTNVQNWKIFKAGKKKGVPCAEFLHEINFSKDTDQEVLAEDFYPFTRASYLGDDWERLAEKRRATSTSDILAIMLCDKSMQHYAKMLKDVHDIKVGEEEIRAVIEQKIVQAEEISSLNKTLLKKLNAHEEKKPREKKESEVVVEAAHVVDAPPPLPEVVKVA